LEKTTLYLPTELLASYTALSRTQKRAKAELMRDALSDYVEKQERTLPEWVEMIESEGEFDSTNVKAWIGENWDPE